MEAQPNNLQPAARPATAVTPALAASLGLAFCTDLSARTASAEFVDRIPIGFARQHGVIGLAGGDGRLPVALGDLSAWGQLQVVSRFLGRAVEAVLAPPADVAAAINAAYQQRTGQAQTYIEKLDPASLTEELGRLRGRGRGREGRPAGRGRAGASRPAGQPDAVRGRAVAGVGRALPAVRRRRRRPPPHRRRAAQRLPAAQAFAGGTGQPGEGDGADEHRREAPAAGRAGHRAGGRPGDRPAHRHAAHQLRRARRRPPARQEHAAVRPARVGDGSRTCWSSSAASSTSTTA